MPRFRSRRSMMLRLATSAGALVVATASHAQASQAVPPAGPGAQLSDNPQAAPESQTSSQAPTPANGDIIVTAQKRSENLQNVPLAVSVVSAQQLQANAVRNFADLNRVAPSLVVRPAENPTSASISIRGVGTFATSLGVEPSVAVVVDDVPLAFQARAFTDLSDVARIEVLQGPQSTLYGRSASAGLVNIVTNAPSKTFTARLSGLATGDDEQRYNGIISGPITPNLAFRSTLNFNRWTGNVHNLAALDGGHTLNGFRTVSTNNKLVWDPTSRLNVTAQINYVKGSTTIGRPFIAVSPQAALRGNPALGVPVFLQGITVNKDNQDVRNDYLGGTRYWDFAQSLRISYDLGGPTLLSITAHDKYYLHDRLDQDDTATSLSNYQNGTFFVNQWSQEVRLVSPNAQRLRYTLGLFYLQTYYNRFFVRGPSYSQASSHVTFDSASEAGFGQLEYDLFPGTTLIGGGRYAHERIDYGFLNRLSNVQYKGGDDDSFGTYKAGVQQRLAPNAMVFLTYATGHKSETYDLSTGFNAARQAAGPIKPETSKDWELGARLQFFDRKLTLNVTLFDTRYRNLQSQSIESIDGVLNFRLTNVGRLRTRGVEVDTSARLVDGLNVGLSTIYDDAEILSYPTGQCYPGQTAAQGCLGTPAFQDLAGKRPPQAPKWKVTANFDYTHDLGSLPFQGVIQGAYTYQSKINYNLNQDPQTEQRGYGIANLSFGIRHPERKYELLVFVNNLFDKQYFPNLTDSYGNFGNTLATQSYLPRDFRRYAGVQASYAF